ncbi:MAG: hypothetical protein APR63_10955 [Desulfuromonas sp. SDB]|nr:MAG: hypothetical protein APR63_10955 [Desulfuromonas sp. SDB]
MKNILIVDDDHLLIKSLLKFLNKHIPDKKFYIHTAENGCKAIEILNSQKIDLIITDLVMPKLNGFKLIAYVIGQYPTIPVVVMTAFGNRQTGQRIRKLGILNYIEKPIDFRKIYQLITNQKIYGEPQTNYPEKISSLMQIISMENMTSTLRISTKDKIGNIYFRNGDLIHASVKSKIHPEHPLELLDWINKENQNSLNSALDIVSWEDVKIDLMDTCNQEERTIEMPLEYIILEGLKNRKIQPNHVKTPDKIAINEDKIPSTIKIIKAMELFKNEFTPGVINSDIIYVNDAKSLASWNSNDKSSGLFTEIVQMMNEYLHKRLFNWGDYIVMDLADNKIALIILMNRFIWSILVDGSRIQLGTLLSIILPKAVQKFKQAFIEETEN